MVKPEIPVGKSYGSCHSVWEASENMGCDLDDAIFLVDVDTLHSDSHSRNFAFNCLMFMPEISNRMVFVNGKHPS